MLSKICMIHDDRGRTRYRKLPLRGPTFPKDLDLDFFLAPSGHQAERSERSNYFFHSSIFVDVYFDKRSVRGRRKLLTQRERAKKVTPGIVSRVQLGDTVIGYQDTFSQFRTVQVLTQREKRMTNARSS